jgi:CubicO group peptidase (beta-lactamase class C family)
MQPPYQSSRVRLAFACATSLLLCACGPPLEVELPRADPKVESSAGLSRLSTWLLDGFLELSARIGAHSGYVAIFARDGRVVHATTAGYADIESERPMQLDTRFRIASMTKLLTAVAAMILVEEGRLHLDDLVSRYIPAAGEVRVAASHSADAGGAVPTLEPATPLTVRHLLTFTAGIGSKDDPSDLGKL